MSFADGLLNTVVIEQRMTTTNETNEEIESFNDGATIKASVQDKADRTLSLPDVDGPVIVNAVVYMAYRTDIVHLARIRQTDVSPTRTYRVLVVRDPAGRHHHLEIDCERILTTPEGGS